MKCLLRREARVESSSGEAVSWKVGMPLFELVGVLKVESHSRDRFTYLVAEEARWRMHVWK